MKKNNEIEKQFQHLRRQKSMLWVAILLFVLVILWILVIIFTSSHTSAISAEQRELAKPFVPRLESRIFEDLRDQRVYSQTETIAFPVYVIDKTDLSGTYKLIDVTALASSSSAVEPSPVAPPDTATSAAIPSEVFASDSSDTQ